MNSKYNRLVKELAELNAEREEILAEFNAGKTSTKSARRNAEIIEKIKVLEEQIDNIKDEYVPSKEEIMTTFKISESDFSEEYLIDLLNDQEIRVANLENDLRDAVINDEDTTTIEKALNSRKNNVALLNSYLDNLEDELMDDVDYINDEDSYEKESLFRRTKKVKAQKNTELKESIKKAAKVVGAGIIIFAIAASVSKCVKNADFSKASVKEKTYIEQIYDEVDKTTVKQLEKLGYSEYNAILMAYNFTPDVIESILNLPYIETVNNYVTENGFKIDYLNDYENARTIYTLTANEAVDYVNRAYLINETDLYKEATINEIVNILNNLNDKELYKQETASLQQSFNTAFHSIQENYLFGTLNDADVKKIDALYHFAKEGSDLDQFLTEFANLEKELLINQNNTTARNDMYNLLYTFTVSANEFNNESDATNELYQVNDHLDWYMAYNLFIAPLYPTIVDENDLIKYYDLQDLMISNLHSPEMEVVCESLSLKK